VSRDRARRKPKSAAELMAELAKDPDFAARARARERRKEQSAQAYAEAAAPLLEELAAAGAGVKALADLRKPGAGSRAGVPVLLRWLPRAGYAPLKEEIVRALSVPWARPQAAPVLIEELDRAEDAAGTGIRWAIANALAVVADDSVFDEIAARARDPGYGKAREMLCAALGNMKDPRAEALLAGMLSDDAVAGHAVMALGKLRAASARDRVEAMTRHPKAWVRKEAMKALRLIDSGGS
jgi:hypothetical protein